MNTPTERRKLPETPLERARRMSYSVGNLGTPVRASLVGVNKDSKTQVRISQAGVNFATQHTPQARVSLAGVSQNVQSARVSLAGVSTTPSESSQARQTRQVLSNNQYGIRRRQKELAQRANTRSVLSSGRRERTSNRHILRDENNKPDYKRTAYLDAHSYARTLDEEIELDKIVKMYLLSQESWSAVTNIIASEVNKVKTPRQRKGPWMKNRRENRNTRKARIYQFTQKAYDQNKKATMHKIINGNFSLNNREQVYPNIEDVEKTC